MRKKIIIIVSILAIIGIAIGVTALINNKTNNKGPVEAYGYTTTTMSRPTDGTTIDDYNSYDNLAIVAGVMANADFNGVTEGEVKAKVAFINYTQDVYNIRTIIGDEGFQQAISTSSLKSVAIQKYFLFAEDKALTRNPDKINGKDTTWLDETPQVYSTNQYLNIYGWLPNQISSYILCKESILEISDIILNDDETYSINLSLDPNIAPANYQYEVKTYGGSSDFPSFSSINLTIKFDANWQLLEISSDEVYDITMPVIGSITCTANMTETFTYDNLEIKDRDFFADYFDLTPSDNVPTTPEELKPTDYFMYGFGNYLNGDILTADISININDKLINGTLSLDILNNKYIFKSNDLLVNVIKDDIYLSYDEIKIKTNLNELTNLLSTTDLNTMLDTTALMQALDSSEIIKENDKIILKANLPILNQNIAVEFSFNNDYSINYIKANLSINDININIDAKISPNKLEINEDFNTYQDLANLNYLIDDIKNIINNKALKLDINFNKDDIIVNGQIKASFKDNLLINGILNINYNNQDIIAKINYKDNIIYLDLAGLKLSLDTTVITNNIDKNEIDINKIIDLIYNIDYKKLINNFNLTNILELGIDLSSYSLSNYNLTIKEENEGFSININELNLSLIINPLKENIINDIEGKYYDISNIINNSDKIIDLLKEEYLNINLNTTINYNDINIPINLDVNINMLNKEIYAKGSINLFNNILNIELIYKDKLVIKIGNNLIADLTDLNINNLNESILDLSFLNDILDKLIININDNNLLLNIDNINISGININNLNLNITKGNEFETPTYNPNLNTTDLINLINNINKIIDIISKDNINILFNYNGIEGNIIIDKEFNIEALININDLEFKVNYYNDGSIYLTYNNISISTNIDELINIINKYFNNSDNELSLDLNNLINNLEIREDEINLNILDFIINLKISDVIKLNINDINLEITNTKNNISDKPLTSISLNLLLPYIDKLIDFVNNNYLNININTNINNLINIDGLIEIDIKNLIIKGNIKLNILDNILDIELLYKDKLYLKIGNNIISEIKLNELLKHINDDFNIDSNNLINKIEVDNGLLINIFGIDLKLNINDNNLLLNIDNINISGININNLNLNITKGNEFEIPTYNPNLNTTDLINLINNINKIIDIISKDNINVLFNYNGIEGNIIIDKEFNIEALININDLEFKVNYYNDGSIYLTYNNISISTNIDELINIINKYFNNSDNELSLDLNNLINNLEIREDEINLNILDFIINLKISDVIKLNINDINLEITNTKNNISDKPLTSISLNLLLPYIDKLIDFVNNNYLNININTNINNLINIDGLIEIDIKNLIIKGNIKLNILDNILDIELLYKDKLYLKIGNNIISEIKLNELLKHINDDFNIDSNNLINKIEVDNGLLINIFGIDLKLNINDNNLLLNIDNINISGININNLNLNITKGNEFEIPTYNPNLNTTDLINLINNINKIIDIISKDNINVLFNYNGIEGNIIIDKEFNINGLININGEEISINYIDNLLYISYGNIGLKGTINDLINIINEFSDNKVDNINFDLNDLIKSISTTENSINLNILGLDLNIEVSDSINIIEKNNNILINIATTTTNISAIKDINYLDVNVIYLFIPSIKELLNNKTINLDLNTNINNILINGLINIDLNGRIYADIKLNNKINLLLSLNNNIMKIKFNNNVIEVDLNKLINNYSSLSSLFNYLKYENEELLLGLNIKDINLNLVIDKDLNIKLNDLNVNNIIIKDSYINTSFNNLDILDINDDITIKHDDLISIIDEIYKLIELFNNEVINIKLNTELIAEETKFIIDGNFNINLNEFSLIGSVNFITSAGLKHIVYINYLNNNLSLAYGNLGIDLSVSELELLINRIIEMFNIDNNISLDFDLYKIINSLEFNYNNGLNVSLDLLNFGLIKLNLNDNKINISDINFDVLSLNNLNVSINLEDRVDNLPNIKYLNYNDLNILLDYVLEIINLSKEEGFSFNILGTINLNGVNYNINGEILILLKNGFELKALINVGDEHYLEIYRVIEDNKAKYYAIYDNLLLNDEGEELKTSSLNFKANEDDLMGLINTLSNFFNFDFSNIEGNLAELNGFNIIDIVDKIDFSKLLKSINIINNDNELALNIIIGKELLSLNNDITLSVVANKGENFSLARIEVINLGISSINISNLEIDYNGIYNNDIEVPSLNYYDLSMLNPLLQTIFNTALLTDFNIKGNINVNAKLIGINVPMNIALDAKIKRVDGSNIPEIYIKLANIPILGLINNDTPHSAITNANRTLEILFKDGYVYLNRIDSYKYWFINHNYYKQLKLASSDFMNDILYYLLQYGFGFSEKIMNAINDGISTDHTIDFTNVITDFNTTENNDLYSIGINLAEVTGNDMLDSFTLDIYPTNKYEKTYLGKLAFNVHMPLLDNVAEIDISTSDLTLVNIGDDIDLSYLYNFINNYKHEVGVKMTSTNGTDWENE